MTMTMIILIPSACLALFCGSRLMTQLDHFLSSGKIGCDSHPADSDAACDGRQSAESSGYVDPRARFLHITRYPR